LGFGRSRKIAVACVAGDIVPRYLHDRAWHTMIRGWARKYLHPHIYFVRCAAD